MAITQNDLEILKSEIMADTPDGGGLPTGIAVIDGVSNNLFPDVSDIDRLIGRVRLRKVSLAVKTANAELLQAVRMLFTELPENPNISVFAFKASSFADRRVDAQNKIESYLTFGARWSGHLLETQLTGQRVIQLSLDKADEVPKIGKPLVIVQNEGQSDEFYQYIRPTKVDVVERRFQRTVDNAVTRVIATIEFAEPLKRTFTGLAVNEFYQNINTGRRAVLREAQVSDAAKYYSASRLAEPVVAMTTRKLRINSIYTQIVPSSTTETALPLLNPVGQSKTSIRSSDKSIAINKSVSVSPATPWQIGSGIYPSSLALNISGIAMTDNDAELKGANGVIYASVDYETGRIVWYDTASFGVQTVTGSFIPASHLMRVSQTEIIYTPETEVGTSYIQQLQVEPSRGSMQVSFQVRGQVTTIRDDAKGSLIDSDGKAYGIIDYENKLVQLVLPAIPDAESAIIFTYSTGLGAEVIDNQIVKGVFEFSGFDYIPDGAVITWDSKTATIANGLVSGDATGTYSGVTLVLTPNDLPAKGTEFLVSFDKPTDISDVKKGSGTSTSANSNLSFNVGAVDAGTFRCQLKVTSGNWLNLSQDEGALPDMGFAIADDGLGNIVFKDYYRPSVSTQNIKMLSFNIAGTINYLTGDVTVNISMDAQIEKITSTVRKKSGFFRNFRSKVVVYSTDTISVSASVKGVSYSYNTLVATGGTEPATVSYIASQLIVKLPSDDSQAPILPRSVSILGAIDADGLMVRDGVTVGSINYQNGKVLMNEWDTGANSITVVSAARGFATPPVSSIVFRTPLAPIKIGTFTINLTANSVPYQITADADGNIKKDETYTDASTGQEVLLTGITGFIDYESGVVALYGNGIDPESVSYTAMSYTYTPLDSELIGLDPVRLPTDGRVPFVRKGDSIAITELKTMQLPTNAPNDSFDLGFERLSDVNVVDSTGKNVSFDYLDIDLDAGTLQLNGLFDMSFYTAPLTAKYRIMDIALVIETDISGRVTLSTPITHDYSTAAVFSSMLLAGDMQARAYNVFGQKSWGSVWSDSLIGDATTSQLQVTNNPIVVTNRDAIEERWALVFTSDKAFNIIGQTVGQIGTGTTSTLTAPINPMTGYAYFTIPAAAWGTGWSANNVVRINTAAAKYPVWIGNAIQQHQGSSADNYDFTIGYHTNIDRERAV